MPERRRLRARRRRRAAGRASPRPAARLRPRSTRTGAPGSLPERIDYPIAAKYADEALSRVSHRLIGAWDARPDEPTLAHLRVQVFDSERAARLPSWIDDGAAKAAHRVAELRRIPDPALSGLEVRGRRLDL